MEYATYDATQANKKLPVRFVFLTDTYQQWWQIIFDKNAGNTMAAFLVVDGAIL